MIGRQKKFTGLDDMTSDDLGWAQAMTENKGGHYEAMLAAVEDNKPARVRFILGNYKINEEQRYQAVVTAVESSAPEALSALLEYRGFSFVDPVYSDNKSWVRKLFELAASGPASVWKVLYSQNKATSYPDLNEDAILKIAASPKTSPDVIQFYMESSGHVKTFELFIKEIGLHSTEKLEFILTWTPKFNDALTVLNEALVKVAEAGDLGKAELLLQRGADPNYSGAQALTAAAESGQQQMVDRLLPSIDIGLYGSDILTRLRQTKPDSLLVAQMDKIIRNTQDAGSEKRFRLVDADTISETQHLPGKDLTILFNFRSRQQTHIVEKIGTENALAVAVTGFDDIGDQSYIEVMHDKLVEMGGNSDHAPRLPKLKL